LKVEAPPPPVSPTPDVAAGGGAATNRPPEPSPAPAVASPGTASEPWLLLLLALVAGGTLGGIAVWVVVGRRRKGPPPRRRGQSPADRARELQTHLEQWWVGVRGSPRAGSVRAEVEALRRELEQVRFAPGRADHSETVSELEVRLRRLIRSDP
jgi:hypothetical protein